jgi:hypothetical protein
MPKVLLGKSILLAKHDYWLNKISKILLDIVFRFIIEYGSLKGFWHLGDRSILYEDFLKEDILACVET